MLGGFCLSCQVGDNFKIVDECLHLEMPSVVVRRSQDGRGMYRCHDEGSERGIDELSALTHYAEGSSQQRLRGGRTQAPQNLRLYRPQFSVKPRTTGVDFRVARLFVNALLSPNCGDPLEMFHHIGQIHLRALEPDLFQSPVEKLSSRSHKKMPGAVFLISRLLADEHDLCLRRTFAKHGLRSCLPQVAGLAVAGGLPKSRDCLQSWGDKCELFGSTCLIRLRRLFRYKLHKSRLVRMRLTHAEVCSPCSGFYRGGLVSLQRSEYRPDRSN